MNTKNKVTAELNKETERKFLVKGEFKPFATHHFQITQGYISTMPERTVRVRIVGGQGFLTIKGKRSDDGLTRFEWEKEISVEDATILMELCLPGIIEKTRYIIPFEGHIFEVDEFTGENKGLIIAEIELESAETIFLKPSWLGKEVTDDNRYYNAMLTQNPYKNW